MKIELLEIAGMRASLEALRLPFGKEARSITDFNFSVHGGEEDLPYAIESSTTCAISRQDITLMSTLVKRGDEHSKVVRGINAWISIDASRGWWQEMNTYRMGVEGLSSESTMHTIGKGVTIDDFDVEDEIKQCLIPNKKETVITPLYFDEPDKLECKIMTFFGVNYEIWNNGDIYVCERIVSDILPCGSKRDRIIPKKKISTGTTKNKQGYYQVHLGGRKGRTMVIHRIMAMAFVDNPNKLR